MSLSQVVGMLLVLVGTWLVFGPLALRLGRAIASVVRWRLACARRGHWAIFVAAGLVGATVVMPNVLTPPGRTVPQAGPTSLPAHRPDNQMDTANRVVVICGLKDRDAQLAAYAFSTKNRALLDQISVGCHIPANGPFTSCTFMPPEPIDLPSPSAPRDCLARAPPMRFAVRSQLGASQVERQVRVVLNDEPIGIIHIYQGKPAGMLVIALPEGGSYTYSVETVDTYYDLGGRRANKQRRASGTFQVHDGQTFDLVDCPCNEQRILIKDITPAG